MQVLAGFGIIICLLAFFVGLLGIVKPSLIKTSRRRTGALILVGSMFLSGIIGALMPKPPEQLSVSKVPANTQDQKTQDVIRPKNTDKPPKKFGVDQNLDALGSLRSLSSGAIDCEFRVDLARRGIDQLKRGRKTPESVYDDVVYGSRTCAQSADNHDEQWQQQPSFLEEISEGTVLWEGAKAKCRGAIKYYNATLNTMLLQIEGDLTLKTNRLIQDNHREGDTYLIECKLLLTGLAEETGLSEEQYDFLDLAK